MRPSIRVQGCPNIMHKMPRTCIGIARFNHALWSSARRCAHGTGASVVQVCLMPCCVRKLVRSRARTDGADALFQVVASSSCLYCFQVQALRSHSHVQHDGQGVSVLQQAIQWETKQGFVNSKGSVSFADFLVIRCSSHKLAFGHHNTHYSRLSCGVAGSPKH